VERFQSFGGCIDQGEIMQELEDLRQKVKALMDSFLVFVAVFEDHRNNMAEMMGELERLRRDRGLDGQESLH
jgi:hypothetical protein